MKKLILSLLLLIPVSANAERKLFQEAPHICDSIAIVKADLEKYNEKPLFIGSSIARWIDNKSGNKGQNDYVMLFLVNQTTGTWTMLQLYKDDDMACIAAAGNTFTPFVNEGKIQ
jgi:hypothetical protein